MVLLGSLLSSVESAQKSKREYWMHLRMLSKISRVHWASVVITRDMEWSKLDGHIAQLTRLSARPECKFH